MFFCSLYLLITFFILRKPRFTPLTSELPHSLSQLNGFSIILRVELRNVVNTVKTKRAKLKETGYTYKARSFSHSAVGYQSSLKRLFAGICFMLLTFNLEA